MKLNEEGFSLVESLVAVALMAIAISGLAMMNMSTMQADAKSSSVNTATALAQDKLEELRVLRRSAADWTEGTHGPETGLDGSGNANGGPYTRQWEVDLNYNGFDNLSRVTVTVSRGEDSVSVSSLYW